MKIVFAGTPEFASLAYKAIVQAGFDVPLVLTQPDRPAGRGMKLTPSAVKQVALSHGATVLQPMSLKLNGRYPEDAKVAQEALEQCQPDVMVVAAYGLILPQWVLDLPRFGCLNIHASLLPRWRGAAPIQRAIEAGDSETGIGIMQMEAGLDTGPVLLEKRTSIGDRNAAQLHDVLAQLGSQAIVQVLTQLKAGQPLSPKAQSTEGVTYAEKLSKAESLLNPFEQDATTLWRKIRAFNPMPGASLKMPALEQPLKVWQAQVLDTTKQAIASDADPQGPAVVLSKAKEGVDIACRQGVLRLKEVQKAGGKRQTVDQFVQGWHYS